MDNKVQLNRGFGLTASLALVVGTIIGSGIFLNKVAYWRRLVVRRPH